MGKGHYGASRGSRSHRGVDFACYPSSVLVTPVTGEVTKIGYPYADGVGGVGDTEEAYRYVQVTDMNGDRHRFFYVEPLVEVGQVVIEDSHYLGVSQSLKRRHGAAMDDHIHYEVIDSDGNYKEPS